MVFDVWTVFKIRPLDVDMALRHVFANDDQCLTLFFDEPTSAKASIIINNRGKELQGHQRSHIVRGSVLR